MTMVFKKFGTLPVGNETNAEPPRLNIQQTALTTLSVAQNFPKYLKSLQKHLLISARKTGCSIRRKLICIGENYLDR